MKRNKAFKYRIYPNQSQRILINKTFGCCRFIYNKMLEDKILYYQENGEALKNTPAQYKGEFEWLTEVDSMALCSEQMHLQSAFNNFFKNKKFGFPKFKSRRKTKRSYSTCYVSIRKDGLHLGKLGKVSFTYHRAIPSDYKIKSATISQSASSKYYISILTEYEYEVPNKQLDKSKSIGLDYSSHNFYVDSQGTEALQEHYFRQIEMDLAKQQRILSHMTLGSNNYYKQLRKVGRIHEKANNKRKDFVEKLSTKLSREYDIVCVEDLNLKGISQSLRLGKATMDNGFGMFREKLQQKLEIQGKKLVKIDKWFPSSKMCNVCGCINKGLRLKDRAWTCTCGANLNRDLNAAINIRNEGLRQLA